jgi:pyruvate kinase
MSRVKIVATIGPRTLAPGAIRALVAAGMDVARLNGSHADLAWHARAIEQIRRAAPGVPILLDIPGRKIRTRQLVVEPAFEAGDTIILTTSDHPGEGDGRDGRVGVNRADLHLLLTPGATVMADDGTLRFTVIAIDGRDIACRAETAGTLRSAKGINVPTVDLSGTGTTERDRTMLAFAGQHGVDFVGISFVSSAKHVTQVRELLGPAGPRVLAKIENLDGMAHLDEVIEAADAIMIDRGDLSVETDLATIALAQKRIVSAATGWGKPVIVATEMLHSMIEHPFPTKAEVTDISNAVLDGAAALMLSGETAIGRHPVEAVELMRRVADAVVASTHPPQTTLSDVTVPRAMGEAIGLLCERLPITRIVAITRSGYAARIVASSRPAQPILVVSDDPATARSMNLLYGTEGVHVEVPFSRTSTDHIVTCLEELWQRGKLLDSDVVLVTSVGYPRSGNRMNLIETHAVADLRDSLGWLRRAA